MEIDSLEGINVFKTANTQSLEASPNGIPGRIFMRLDESRGKTPRMECIDWYYSQSDVYWYTTRVLPPCPCTFWQALRDRSFFLYKWEWPRSCFYSSFPTRYQWGQECCYKFFTWRSWWWGSWWRSFLAVGYPDGGNAHR